jgi:hypothetical protein
VQPVAHPPRWPCASSLCLPCSHRRRDRLCRGSQSAALGGGDLQRISRSRLHRRRAASLPDPSARPAYRVLERVRYRNCSRVPCCSSIVRPAKGSPTTVRLQPPSRALLPCRQHRDAWEEHSRRRPGMLCSIPRCEGFRATRRIPRPHNRRPARIPRVHSPPRQALDGRTFHHALIVSPAPRARGGSQDRATHEWPCSHALSPHNTGALL